MSGADALSGLLHLQPGLPVPRSLVSTRPAWAGVVTRGQPAALVPPLLGRVFTLCGHAHTACASLALSAATGQADPPAGVDVQALRLESLREHLQRLCLDWPRQLAAPEAPGPAAATAEAALAALRVCPLWAAAGQGRGAAGASLWAALLAWLEQHLLGMPAQDWLAQWEAAPLPWLAAWCGAASATQPHGWLADLLRPGLAEPCGRLPARADGALQLRAGHPAALHVLAAQLGQTAGFVHGPAWRGAWAETGTWTRAHDRPATAAEAASLLWRLGSRVAEAVRLCMPTVAARSGAGWLDHGVLPLGPGAALAWVEMARGLLVHRLRLSASSTEARVLQCQVLAPTDWNFHGHGAVARALAALPSQAHDTPLRTAWLMAAYDPCMRYEMGPQTSPSPVSPEVAHA